jgi:hypothetical protein
MSYIKVILCNISVLTVLCKILSINWYQIFKKVSIFYPTCRTKNVKKKKKFFAKTVLENQCGVKFNQIAEISYDSHSNKINKFCLLDELKREREFYKARNMPCPKDLPQVPDNDEALEKLNEAHQETDYHRQDEQVNVCLECISNNLKHLKRRFIRCSSQATITHLKKFIAKKVLNGMDKYRDVRIISLLNFEFVGMKILVPFF